MIVRKLWAALRAQINKVANFFLDGDPIAQMQYEYDSAVEQLSLVARLGAVSGASGTRKRQVANDKQHVTMLEAKIKRLLAGGRP